LLLLLSFERLKTVGEVEVRKKEKRTERRELFSRESLSLADKTARNPFRSSERESGEKLRKREITMSRRTKREPRVRKWSQ